MFTPSKAGQMAAWFASRSEGIINVLKLVKLIYLSDRESLREYAFPISYDRLVSMDHGPAPSRTLNLINGYPRGDGWSYWISDRDNHDVAVVREVNREDLDELSDADLEIMQRVWEQFGGMSQWELSEYTHKHCPEWRDPNGSSLPIHERKIFLAFGHSLDEAVELAHEIEAQRELDQVFARNA